MALQYSTIDRYQQIVLVVPKRHMPMSRIPGMRVTTHEPVHCTVVRNAYSTALAGDLRFLIL